MTRPRTAARDLLHNGGCLAAAVLAVAALAGCGLAGGSPASSATGGSHPAPVAAASATAALTPSGPPCPRGPAGFPCPMRLRIAEVRRYLSHRPGVTGVVLRDRATGAVWRNRYAGTQIYMASTSKLAMATTLLAQNEAGVIHLSPADWAVMYQMLHVSSDNAADDLWFKYGAPFYTSFFPKIGLASAQYLPQTGVTGPYWGEMTCTAEDESRLIDYVLDKLPAPLRNYLVYQLRHVAQVQHFGVWGAGLGNEPGNKDGWSVEKPGWIIDSVGFAGPGEQYTLAMMNSLNGQGDYTDGTQTLTQVAALLLRGHHVPAPRVSATP